MVARKKQRASKRKEKYYLDLAQESALRSTCLRRNFGAVIVKHDQVIATGYGGAPKDTPHCTDIGLCYRGELGARPGEHYEFCRAVHAEQNAIIQAPRLDMLGAVLYLVGLDGETKDPLWNTEPCRICKRHIVNAGIQTVIARQGEGRVKKYSVATWVRNWLGELRKQKNGRFVPKRPLRTLSEPADEKRAKRLVSQFSLADAIVVQIASYQQGKHAVARVAARYFISKVKSRKSVALSCGDTILSMIQSLPNQPKLRLNIHQLSIENDPAMIHQAPATLVGLLRSRCSPESHVFGLQLPPLDLVASSPTLREELLKTNFLKKMRRDALRSDYVFVGLGSAGSDSTSFWAMAQAATGGKFSRFVKKLGIVGEINNQVFNRSGEDCTHLIPGFEKYVVNIATLADIRKMARKPEEHKVVMIANGRTKTEAMRVALETGLANVLITGREDADQLLGG